MPCLARKFDGAPPDGSGLTHVTGIRKGKRFALARKGFAFGPGFALRQNPFHTWFVPVIEGDIVAGIEEFLDLQLTIRGSLEDFFGFPRAIEYEVLLRQAEIWD